MHEVDEPGGDEVAYDRGAAADPHVLAAGCLPGGLQRLGPGLEPLGLGLEPGSNPERPLELLALLLQLRIHRQLLAQLGG